MSSMLRERIRKGIRVLCVIVLAAAAVLIGIRVYKNMMYSRKETGIQEIAGDHKDKKEFAPDLAQLMQINPDTIGYIYFPELDISQPVVYRKNDNSYYLYRDFYQKPDEFGAVFLNGYNNAPLFTDGNSIVFGHTVFGWKGMFTGIRQLADREAFDKRRQFTVFTKDGGKYTCEIFAFEKTYYNDLSYQQDFYLDDQRDSWMAQVMDRAQYARRSTEAAPGEKIITLSTCADQGGLRYIVHAVAHKK